MPTTTVLCLGPAGAGPSFFRGWVAPDADIRVEPVSVPGRERRFGEPAQETVAGLLGVLVPEVLPVADAADRVVVLGHCYGAIVAYELCQALAAARPGLPLALVASGSTRPGVPRGGRITGLPDDEFVEGVERIAGYTYPALGRLELREVLLPPMRADVAMQESYEVDRAAPLLDIPVLSVRGADDTIVDAAKAAQWREITTGPFELAELEGGHMYLVEGWPGLLALVAETVRAWDHAGKSAP
ncbi:thioesterase II family protein [Lentzea sp. NPDC060358]|uniref:thioesterase II family protein n=1 Tax=Lentzea sp. NPDC060358 TaxID=3347103 RepID=UPI0036659918